MRTLIIDNYDSFTFNLFHLVAEVTGVTPVVVRNDEPGWTTDQLLGFDSVVISPGPGRPERSADFGICGDVIRQGSRPLLGVCLGHQGICSVFGGEIRPAPEPVHGRRSRVFHDQIGIFAGLPSPFSAVRYHSLMATRLPAELEATGWSADGVVMAVRHRTRPIWGVQFHPESICTEHGHRLLSNFVDLGRRWHAGTRRRRPAPTPAVLPTAVPAVTPAVSPAAVDTATPAGRLEVQRRSLPLALEAEDIFDTLYKDSEHSFWLDSSLRHPAGGRFSYVGDASGPLARVATADVSTGRVTVRSATTETTVESAFLDWLDADLRGHQLGGTEVPFDFGLGWVGYLGYELKGQCGAARAHHSPHPDAAMMFVDRAIVVDHARSAVDLVALHEAGDPRATERWLAETVAELTSLATRRRRRPPPVPVPSGAVGSLSLRHDRGHYLALISACQRKIRAGETYEICLTNTLTARAELDPWNTYRLLRRENPAPFGAYLRLGTLSVLSSSPERFLRVGPDRRVESKPIKGTRPRGTNADQDAWMRRSLAGSVKDRAENLMIVDLVRNDLGTCAEPGSVRVDKLFDVESYASVHQLVSTVQARLRPKVSAVECARRSFPGGSMTGAPKLRTMTILDDLEARPRGVYSGALGYFSLSGTAELSMVIRTVVLSAGSLTVGVGGAIIALSDPDAEWEELAVKAAPILRVLGREFPQGSATTTPGCPADMPGTPVTAQT